MAEIGNIENGIFEGKKAVKLNKGDRLVLPTKEELPQLYLAGGFFSNEEVRIKLTKAVSETELKKQLEEKEKELLEYKKALEQNKISIPKTEVNSNENDTPQIELNEEAQKKALASVATQSNKESDILNNPEDEKSTDVSTGANNPVKVETETKPQEEAEQTIDEQTVALASLSKQTTEESDIFEDIIDANNDVSFYEDQYDVYGIKEDYDDYEPTDYSGDDQLLFDETINKENEIDQNIESENKDENNSDFIPAQNTLKEKKKHKKRKEFFV